MGAFVFVPARLNWLVTLHLFGDSLAMWCVRIRLALRLRTAPVAETQLYFTARGLIMNLR